MFKNFYRDPIEQENTIDLLAESVSIKEKHLQIFQWLDDQVMISNLSPIPSLSLSDANVVIIILGYIRDEELKHFYLLQNLYFKLTGSYPPLFTGVYYPPNNLWIGLQYAISENLECINRYQRIINGLSSIDDINVISNIISDELRHLDLYNYLLKQFV